MLMVSCSASGSVFVERSKLKILEMVSYERASGIVCGREPLRVMGVEVSTNTSQFGPS